MAQKLVLVLLLASLCACSSISPKKLALAEQIAVTQRDYAQSCADVSACANDSLFQDMADHAFAISTPDSPRHEVVLLESGSHALAARLNLIRSAQKSIDIQSFIFVADDSGTLVLHELMRAAKRGVRVRILLDQLYGLSDPNLQATLTSYHHNFELRLYNPTFDEARTQGLQFAAGILCCFKRFNQRMHTKIVLVDDRIGIVGGRNFQDRYFDWDPAFNYRDRDIVIAGPAASDLAKNFELFWRDPKSVPAERLTDVAERLLHYQGAPQTGEQYLALPLSDRARSALESAQDNQLMQRIFSPLHRSVGAVSYMADAPQKHEGKQPERLGASAAMRDAVAAAEHEIILQTPYLVFSRPARKLFKQISASENAPRILVSSNSLAATDAFPVYAMSHKYKRTYIRTYKFEIYESKPYPEDSPIDLATTGALGAEDALEAIRQPMFGSGSAGSAGPELDVERYGVRISMHAKSLVLDRKTAIVGTHNFDPRSDDFNTESFVLIEDPEFAELLATQIERDMSAKNAWRIAPRKKPIIFSGLVYSLGKISEALPILDIWPMSYASSYALKPGCEPMQPDDPKFHECYEDLGSFPQTGLSLKSIYTRTIKAFGSALTPIL